MDDPTVSTQFEQGGATAQPLSAWGPFRLISKVGKGGFGEVYRAWDPELQREVALKLLIPTAAGSDSDVNSIFREARAISRLHHSNIVTVYGVAMYGGRVGFWSEFVNGKTLSALLAEQGPFGWREAALIGIDLCKALAAVHAAGLLHRDVKAANAMREEGGRILLMDFGLTRGVHGPAAQGGTPPYMAPELKTGAPSSVATDIYALGVLLFHLLTGKYPGPGNVNLIDYRQDLPEQLVKVIQTAVDSDPGRRFASAGGMLTALSGVLGLNPVADAIPAVRKTSQPSRRRRLLIVSAVALIAAALAILLWPARNPLGSRVLDPFVRSTSQEDYIQAADMLERYYRPNNVEKSIAVLTKVVRDDPKFAMAYATLGRAYWQRYLDTVDSQYIDKSKAECRNALALDRNLAPPHATLGLIYANTGKSNLAAQELNAALALDPKSAEVYGAMAELLRKQGRAAEVEPTLQKASDLDPADWRWRNQLGLFYLSEGKLDAAQREFNEAVKLTPDNARAYNNLGVAYLRHEQFADAKAAFVNAARLESHYMHFSNLGVVLQLEGDYRGAAEMYLKSVELNPSNYLAWGNLGSVYRWNPSDRAKAPAAYQKAISLAEKTRKDLPTDALLLARLGSYYAAVGKGEQCLPLLRQAVALAPDDPGVVYSAGEAYELLGRRNDALALMKKAVALGYSIEYIRRNPELAGLRTDLRFTLDTGGKAR